MKAGMCLVPTMYFTCAVPAKSLTHRDLHPFLPISIPAEGAAGLTGMKARCTSAFDEKRFTFCILV